MRLSTAPKLAEDEAVILLQDVSVRYRVSLDKVQSLKEFTIKWLSRRMRYRDHWALRGIDLEVHSGQVVGIIGRNGAGKTTLLRVVARVVHPTSGRVRVRGQVAPLLSLGAGFQQDLTGRENILLNGVALGYSRADLAERMDGIVAFSGIGEFMNSPLRTYSSGMRARLGFAIATDRCPDVLLVDEVLAVGDAEFRQRCEDRIERYRNDGMTVLIVSHSPEILARMCDRIVWLDQGALRATGDPDNVIRAYLDTVQGKARNKSIKL